MVEMKWMPLLVRHYVGRFEVTNTTPVEPLPSPHIRINTSTRSYIIPILSCRRTIMLEMERSREAVASPSLKQDVCLVVLGFKAAAFLKRRLPHESVGAHENGTRTVTFQRHRWGFI